MAVQVQSDGTQLADFQYDFALEGKAAEVHEDENGDLWIEGYASDFGLDRQNELFEPGAFDRGLKSFLERNPIMLYHHQYDKALGQFVDARLDAKGLWVKGRVDKPAQGSWAEDIYNKIKRGTIRAFSVGGIFKRRGNRIFDVDLGEISVTPFPVNPRTTFAVVAGKAFEATEEEAEQQEVEESEQQEAECLECEALAEAIESLERTLDTAALHLESKAVTHSSAGHPSLNKSFRKNWVERVGGFGTNNWIYRAAKHLHYDKGYPVGRAIAIAINAARKMCATGDTNFPGKQEVNPKSRAEACAAVAAWERMKARARAKND